jgi:hypothetical protein
MKKRMPILFEPLLIDFPEMHKGVGNGDYEILSKEYSESPV